MKQHFTPGQKLTGPAGGEYTVVQHLTEIGQVVCSYIPNPEKSDKPSYWVTDEANLQPQERKVIFRLPKCGETFLNPYDGHKDAVFTATYDYPDRPERMAWVIVE
jgi:hypothetical protein